MGVACKPGLSNTVVHSRSQLSAKQCLLRRYLFGESSLWISQLIVLECCSSMLLQSEYENCISYFHEQLENFKTCKNWALYSIEVSLVFSLQPESTEMLFTVNANKFTIQVNIDRKEKCLSVFQTLYGLLLLVVKMLSHKKSLQLLGFIFQCR